ncbi:MAG TPA: hypothetical protein VGE43_07665 [Acidimicrobiales bacterium]
MAATKLQMGWTAVQHGSTNITRVDNVSINVDTTLTPYAGDNDRWHTAVVASMNAVNASVTSSDEAVLMGLAGGTTGTFTATHKDAKLASGGDIVYTILNAVCGNVTAGGAHGQYGSSTLNMQCFSADGTTSPISFTRV